MTTTDVAWRTHPGAKGWWRSRFLIGDEEVSATKRGFRTGDANLQRRLETIGRAFLGGYAAGLLEDDVGAASARLCDSPPDLRGFAFEGAAMGAAVADALTFRRARLPAWISANDGRFTYLSHVGAGWALARLPFRRREILGSLDPVHHWLAFDGCGFHDAYFYPRRVLSGWRRVRSGYKSSVYDQGIGRALWFLGGGDLHWAADWIERANAVRRSCLWAGLGLAVTYAGGASAEDLRALRLRAGAFADDLGQGAAFAAAAHAHAGWIPEHARLAAIAITGRDPEALSGLVRATRGALPSKETAPTPRYERWRCAVRDALIGGPEVPRT